MGSPRPQHPRRRKVFSVLAALAAVIVAVTGFSYVRALTAPGSESLGAKSVEWVRTHGGSGIVRWVEREWYSHHQPLKGGHANVSVAQHVPTSFSESAFARVAHLTPPQVVHPIFTSAMAGEGQWTPVGRTVGGVPAVYTTYLRPDPAHSSLVAGIAWMDTKLLKATLYSGQKIPGPGGFHNVAPPSTSAEREIVAEFNSGFLMQDAYGGYFSEGRLVYTMRPGAASLVVYDDGTVTVAQWGRDASMSARVASVRQNLDLIVDHGKLVPGLASDTSHRWGATLGNRLLVWRSGVGVTGAGALVYAGGPGLSVYTLANVLRHAGAIRAMELDINTDWVDYFYFHQKPGRPATPSTGSKLLTTMAGTTARYFQPSSRDFVVMSAGPRSPSHGS